MRSMTDEGARRLPLWPTPSTVSRLKPAIAGFSNMKRMSGESDLREPPSPARGRGVYTHVANTTTRTDHAFE
jgi:hypothetical protein